MKEIVQLRNPLRDSDFDYIGEYVMCLQPLADAIDILQGEGYCFYGYLLPALLCLQRKIENVVRRAIIAKCRPLLAAIKSLPFRSLAFRLALVQSSTVFDIQFLYCSFYFEIMCSQQPS